MSALALEGLGGLGGHGSAVVGSCVVRLARVDGECVLSFPLASLGRGACLFMKGELDVDHPLNLCILWEERLELVGFP